MVINNTVRGIWKIEMTVASALLKKERSSYEYKLQMSALKLFDCVCRRQSNTSSLFNYSLLFWGAHHYTPTTHEPFFISNCYRRSSSFYWRYNLIYCIINLLPVKIVRLASPNIVFSSLTVGDQWIFKIHKRISIPSLIKRFLCIYDSQKCTLLFGKDQRRRYKDFYANKNIIWVLTRKSIMWLWSILTNQPPRMILSINH